MTKIAFFDIDGTLCNSHGKVLPSSTKAIQSFRAAGNLAYICTGRSKPEILDSILAVGFDGVIGAGGGYVVVGDEVVSHKTLPEKSTLEIISFFKKHDIGYYLESNDGLFGSENCVRKIEEAIRKITEKENKSFEEENQKVQWFYELIAHQLDAKINYANVNKISFINNTLPFSDIEKQFGKEFHLYHSTVAMFGPESGEIAVKGIDKKNAVELVLKTHDLEKTDAIAFGDGDNDLAMFEAVGYTVAMANGTDRLKAVANEVTLDADNHGIAESFNKQNWLS